MLGLKDGGSLIGGEQPLLLEQFHHQLATTVQGLPQRRGGPVAAPARCARRAGVGIAATVVIGPLECLRIKVGAEEGSAGETGRALRRGDEGGRGLGCTGRRRRHGVRAEVIVGHCQLLLLP